MDQQFTFSNEWEPFTRHLLEQFEWPPEEFDGIVKRLQNYYLLLPSSEAIPAFLQNLIQAVSLTADPIMALQNFDRFVEGVDKPAREIERCVNDVEHLNFITSLCATSILFTDIIAAHPEYLDWVMKRGKLSKTKPLHVYLLELQAFMGDDPDRETRRALLCRYKRRELLRIGIRDQLQYGEIRELCYELTNLAEACCIAAYDDCVAGLTAQYGLPVPESAANGEGSVCFAVIAMGKFGGNELNFSSDIDLNFIYNEEGQTTGVQSSTGKTIRVVTNQEFYGKLAFEIANYLGELSREGLIYRVDTRLRPEGNAGQIARSFTSYSSFFYTQALAWEKVAYIKARCVAGDEALAEKFHHLVEAFVFSNNDRDVLLPEVARLKRRIDFERLSEEGRRLDIKRGRGGIREIEFIVACYQLLLGNKHPQFRIRSSMDALQLLKEKEFFDEKTSDMLHESYWFFRRVEHQIQMVEEMQTHQLPESERELKALAIRLGFPEVEIFYTTLQEMRVKVRKQFDLFFNVDSTQDEISLLDIIENREAPDEQAFPHLRPYRMDSREGVRALRELALGTNDMAILARGQKAFQTLLPILMGELKTAADPVNAINHLNHMLRSHRAISSFYELIIAHPPILRLLIRSMGFSPFLARTLAAHPDWLDEVLEGDILSQERSVSEFHSRKEGDERIDDLRIYRTRETLFFAIRESTGIETSHRAAQLTTQLAENCLIETINHFVPAELRSQFAVFGMGSLGGYLVHPFGDIDLAFVCTDLSPYSTERQQLELAARKILKTLDAYSPHGQLWKSDCRLRPDGISSPLVTDLSRIKEYYEQSAGLWEFQSATKMRPIFGTPEIIESLNNAVWDAFQLRRQEFDLKNEITTMRTRIENEVKIPRNSLYDLKRSPGGLIDVEFLSQYLILSSKNPKETITPRTRLVLEHSMDKGTLSRKDGEVILDHYFALRLFQRAIRFHFETTKDFVPEDPKAQNALAVAMSAQRENSTALIRNFPERMETMRGLFLKYLEN
ncbi:MAG: hypothetical protein ACFCU1_01620 [Sumerlaeia bacterium]